MQTKSVHTLILGAGPAGLAAGYTLAKAGLEPVVLDRDTVPGGLMRSIRHGDFVVDVGRKELYNRLAKVDDFWISVIGATNYRQYPHRGGYLYEGHILEMSRADRGFRRGMPWSMFLSCAFGFVVTQLNVFAPRPKNVEEYFYRTRGRLLTRVASQGFQEKLAGRRWADIPIAANPVDQKDRLLSTLKAAAIRAFSTKEVNTFKGLWRHPAKGTGQICDALASGIKNSRGSFGLGARILEVNTDDDSVRAVVAEIDSEKICYRPQFVISSVPLDVMVTLTGRNVPAAYTAEAGAPSRRRTVVLVYLFFDRPPRFPHAWLQVTCQRTRIGRITNYSGFESDMVPPGKGCLCCEYYSYGDDPLLKLDEEELARQTLDYCVAAGLIDGDSKVENRVLKLPGADASQNRHNWITSMRLGLLDEVKPFRNLYHVGRTDLDIATLAGIESAEAILSGDRTTFDRHFEPTEIGIRSEPKAFEFKLPQAGQTS